MIQQRRADRFVPAKTDVVREAGLKEVGVERRRDGATAIQLFLVAAAVREEELVASTPVLIDAKGRGGVVLGIDGLEDEIIYQSVIICSSRGDIGMHRQDGDHLLRDWAEICDLVTWEGNAATYKPRRTGRCRGVENLT